MLLVCSGGRNSGRAAEHVAVVTVGGAAGLGVAGSGVAVVVHMQGRAGKMIAAAVAGTCDSSRAMEQSDVRSSDSQDSTWRGEIGQSGVETKLQH